jgi:hypothetical protein
MIEKCYKGLSMATAVRSLLYAVLNTQCNILWIMNKTKPCTNPGIKDFKALLHVFRYLQKNLDYLIKSYLNKVIHQCGIYATNTRSNQQTS